MSGKGFFAVSMLSIHSIIQFGGDVDDLMAYVVLAKHTTGRGKIPYRLSTAGAKAISGKTGLTYRQAKNRLEWLEAEGFIISGDGDTHMADKPEHKSKANKVRWHLNPADDDFVYLSHSLIDGVGKGKSNPPLMRIREEVKKGKCDTIHQARIDAVLLLLHAYQNHSMADFGGIDPAMLHNPWREAKDNVFFEGLDVLVLSLEEDEHPVATVEFVRKIFGSVIDQKEMAVRFWNALSNLKHLSFIYEVIEIWQGNPLENKRAELFYPLYVRDWHARQSDPYVLPAIHSYLVDTGAIDRFIFNDALEGAVGDGSFRLIRSSGGNEHAIGTYRLRFRPGTKDNGEGIAMEQKLADKWLSVLKAASYEGKHVAEF